MAEGLYLVYLLVVVVIGGGPTQLRLEAKKIELGVGRRLALILPKTRLGFSGYRSEGKVVYSVPCMAIYTC